MGYDAKPVDVRLAAVDVALHQVDAPPSPGSSLAFLESLTPDFTVIVKSSHPHIARILMEDAARKEQHYNTDFFEIKDWRRKRVGIWLNPLRKAHKKKGIDPEIVAVLALVKYLGDNEYLYSVVKIPASAIGKYSGYTQDKILVLDTLRNRYVMGYTNALKQLDKRTGMGYNIL
jgi:hypothetical protein